MNIQPEERARLAVRRLRRRVAGPHVRLLPLRLAVLLAFAPHAFAQDADTRIRQLEAQLKVLTEELQAVKAQVKAQADKAAATPASAAPAAPSAPGTDAPPRARAEPPGGPSTGELQDRVQALEAKVEQQGITARFNEGIFFEDPRGNWSLKIGGRVQLDYRDFSHDGTVADTFSVRRARAGVDATLYKDYRIVVEGEFANGNATGTTQQNVALTLGYFDVGWFAPYTRFRLGQFKPAFGYEQTLLDLYSDFMERGLTQNLLQTMNYDRGVMAYGSPYRGLYYAATLGNGVGTNLEERQGSAQEVKADGKEFTFRGVANFAELFDVKDSILQLGGSFRSGTVANSPTGAYTAAAMQTEARGATFFTPAPFNAAGGNVSNISRRLRNAEALLAYGPVKLQGEYTEAEYEGTRFAPGAPLGFNRKMDARYIAAMWLMTGEYYSDFYRDSTVAKIKPRNRFGWGPGSGWGALELGLRYSTFDGSDFKSANPVNTGRVGTTSPVTTSTQKADAYTVQLKWIPNVYTRFWLDWVRTNFDTPIVVNGKAEDHEDAVMFRAQIDF